MVSRSRSDDHREPLTMTTAGQQTSPRGGKRRLLVAMLLIVFGHSTLPVAAANLSEMTGFGSNPGNLRMWTYIPEGLKPNAPLVVALHGCSQSAADYDDETGWVHHADRLGFALLLPEQKPGFWFGNHPLGCFNWYYRGDQQRDGGEVLSIIQMIDTMILTHGSDPSRVYVTGLSAGGAMTATLLATYPERFAGGAIVAGIPFGCARVPDYVPQWAVPYWSAPLLYTNPLRCLKPGIDLSPRQWGARVRDAAESDAATWPPVSIWQGTGDRIVAPANARELTEQWTSVHGLDPERFRQEHINGHLRRMYADGSGSSLVELYLIRGMGHGTPIAPPAQDAEAPVLTSCGIPSEFAIPAGICASHYIARHWGLTNP